MVPCKRQTGRNSVRWLLVEVRTLLRSRLVDSTQSRKHARTGALSKSACRLAVRVHSWALKEILQTQHRTCILLRLLLVLHQLDLICSCFPSERT